MTFRPRPGVRYNLSQFAPGARRIKMRRRVVVQEDDVLVVDGYELDAGVLRTILDPTRRLLWCFVRAEDGSGDLQPLALSEDKVIWLTPGDVAASPSV